MRILFGCRMLLGNPDQYSERIFLNQVTVRKGIPAFLISLAGRERILVGSQEEMTEYCMGPSD